MTLDQYLAEIDRDNRRQDYMQRLRAMLDHERISQKYDYYGIANELCGEVGIPTIHAHKFESALLEAYDEGFVGDDEGCCPTSQDYCEDLAASLGRPLEGGVINDYLCDACYQGEQDRLRYERNGG